MHDTFLLKKAKSYLDSSYGKADGSYDDEMVLYHIS